MAPFGMSIFRLVYEIQFAISLIMPRTFVSGAANRSQMWLDE
jgi:hypothetical protein